MKRFKIKNLVTGLEFQVERNSINPMQPEWGRAAWSETVITPEVVDELGNVITPKSIQIIDHPAEYEITEEDISAEIAAKTIKQQTVVSAQQTLKGLSGKTLTATELKTAVESLLKLIFESDPDLATTLIKIAAQQNK